MRPLRLILVSASFFACGPYAPPTTASVKTVLKNSYAESIFTVRGLIEPASDGGTPSAGLDGGLVIGDTLTFMDAKRLDAYDRFTSPSFSVPYNTQMTFAIDATSLGTTNRLTATVSVEPGTNTLDMVYDYDVALGKFGIEYKWY